MISEHRPTNKCGTHQKDMVFQWETAAGLLQQLGSTLKECHQQERKYYSREARNRTIMSVSKAFNTEVRFQPGRSIDLEAFPILENSDLNGRSTTMKLL